MNVTFEFEIGEEVRIKKPGLDAVVTGLCVSVAERHKAYVEWWFEGKRYEDWILESSLEKMPA